MKKGFVISVSDKKSKLLLIACLIIGTVLFHYGTPHRLMYLHILLQTLFFVPVSLSGWWFGKKGGLAAAAVISAVYIHHAVTVMMPTTDLAVSNGIQIFLLFVVGFLTGTYADIRSGYEEAIREPASYPATTFPIDQRFLMYLDNSGASMNAVRYVANLFGRVPDVKVTLLSVSHRPNPELFESDKEHEEEQSKVLESSARAIEKARELLLRGGFDEARLESRIAHSQNARTSDVILDELKAGGYSAIVVGRHRLSRSEEFLFGSVAIRLARQAACPVWVVGEPSAAGTTSTDPAAATQSPDGAAKEQS